MASFGRACTLRTRLSSRRTRRSRRRPRPSREYRSRRFVFARPSTALPPKRSSRLGSPSPSNSEGSPSGKRRDFRLRGRSAQRRDRHGRAHGVALDTSAREHCTALGAHQESDGGWTSPLQGRRFLRWEEVVDSGAFGARYSERWDVANLSAVEFGCCDRLRLPEGSGVCYGWAGSLLFVFGDVSILSVIVNVLVCSN